MCESEHGTEESSLMILSACSVPSVALFSELFLLLELGVDDVVLRRLGVAIAGGF
jgi:hypothetical protein